MAREGARVKLQPLLIARLTAPTGHFHRDEARRGRLGAVLDVISPGERMSIPIVAFLVEHPSVGAMLIDTGFHAGVAAKPADAFGRAGGLVFKDLEDGGRAGCARAAARARHGSTGHPRGRDDPSALGSRQRHLAVPRRDLSGLSDKEWDAASSGNQFGGYFPRQFDHAFDWRLLDFEGHEADSFATLRPLASTCSATAAFAWSSRRATRAGHLSVILRLKDREALIAGDAIYTMRTLRDSALPYRMEDEHLFRRSLSEIQLYAKETPDAVIIPGHDMERWNELEAEY